ncbi:MAG: hypothetical protein U1A72_08675 [Sulfuritalea sp.]|nr:hypothetical protein [Sulfuritalea sp.]
MATANLARLGDNQTIWKIGTAGLEIDERTFHCGWRFEGDTGVTEQGVHSASNVRSRQFIPHKLMTHQAITDLWIDADLAPSKLAELNEQIEESFIPFHVDFVTAAQLAGRFGEIVRSEARRWM